MVGRAAAGPGRAECGGRYGCDGGGEGAAVRPSQKTIPRRFSVRIPIDIPLCFFCEWGHPRGRTATIPFVLFQTPEQRCSSRAQECSSAQTNGTIGILMSNSTGLLGLFVGGALAAAVFFPVFPGGPSQIHPPDGFGWIRMDRKSGHFHNYFHYNKLGGCPKSSGNLIPSNLASTSQVGACLGTGQCTRVGDPTRKKNTRGCR